MNFLDKLLAAARSNHSLLCVGLDPDLERMPVKDVFDFNRAIIDATQDLVCAYKPNLAFYEALGIQGLQSLLRTVEYVPRHIPVIGDAKRGDIGNTSRAYARALFEVFGFDAITVNPYLGYDSISPFLEYRNKGVFVLCRSSNPGSADIQGLLVNTPSTMSGGELPLFLRVAQKAREWNGWGNIGLVVGATYPRELEQVRGICPEVPLLVPGIGAQGGDLETSVKYGVDSHGERLLLVAARQVLYASSGPDYADAARREASVLRDRINSFRTLG